MRQQVSEIFEYLVNFVDRLTGGYLKDDADSPYGNNPNVRKLDHASYVQFVLMPEVYGDIELNWIELNLRTL